MNKRELRRLAKTAVLTLNESDKAAKDEEIRWRLYGVFGFLEAESAFIYMSAHDEPDTRGIIYDCLSRGIRVFVPKVVDGKMFASEITETSVFVENEYGITEVDGDGYVEKYDFSFNIVPLVAFDDGLNRLGRGKGCYDRFLENATGISVGLAYECQRFDKLETEPHDRKLDVVLTEAKEYR